MNVTHLHILLNHLPTVGMVVAFSLFIVALIARNDGMKRATLVVFVLIALLTIPVYLTGNVAREAIEDLPEVSAALIDEHQNWALLAFIFMSLTGGVAWFALWEARRTSRLGNGNMATVLVLSVITLGLMTWAATNGGEIRHPEIRSAQALAAGDGEPTGWIRAASIESFVTTNAWVWPAAEVLHFLGLAVVLGVVLLINLRMLGMIKGVSFASLHRLLPWAILGFGVNLATGMLFFIGAAAQYTQNIPFYWKVVLLLIAGANALYHTVFDEPWSLEPGQDASLGAKVVAASSIFLWVGVIYFGRMMPFMGTSF